MQKCDFKYIVGILGVIIIFGCRTTFGQYVSGTVFDSANKRPIEFVNIGIVGKNIGTVSGSKGRFRFAVDSEKDCDTILFSMIGYDQQLLKVSDLKTQRNNRIFLKKKDYEISEVTVGPRTFERKILGITSKNRQTVAGFKNNLLGYECGILFKAKKFAILKRVNIDISNCSFDSIFYRLNVYHELGEMDFENVLKEPIYIKMPKELVQDEISIDLESKHIIVNGNFLITLEHIKELGGGQLYFCTGTGSTYFRKTSQGHWETEPIGISISAIVDLEK